MMRKIYTMFMISGVLLMTAACGQKDAVKDTAAVTAVTAEVPLTTAQDKTEAASTETKTVMEADGEITLEDLSKMMGLTDEKAKDLLGGGAENRSSDGKIQIGREYETVMFGKEAKVRTMYDENGKVYFAQAELKDTNVSFYKDEISKAAGADSQPVEKGESGQNQGHWSYSGNMVDLYRSEDTIFIELFVPVV